MYKNQLLKSDFVLCMADVVCNVPLQPILKQHNARRECDKEAIMTLLFQTQTRHNMEVAKLYQHPHIRHLVHTFQTQKHPVQDRNTSAAYTGNERSHDNVNVDDDDDDDDSDSDVDNDASGGVDGDNETGDDDAAVAEDSTSQPLLTHPDDVTVALDAETGQLLLYDTTSLTPTLQLDSTILREHSNGIQFRNDLVNTHIAICSLDVLFHFQDNFDHQTLSQFLRGVVRQEILNAKVFAHVVTPPYYVARANCLRAYNTICRDIVTRWTYPLVPDNNLVFTNHNTVTTYTMSRAYIYTEQNVTLARSCILAEEVVVGDGTHIGEHSFITHSVIGRLCRIGSHVRIVGSYIWDNVIVEDHVTITDSIVCNGAVLKRNVVIPKGSLISFNV
jgi:NDP-sugar pyrophosphorylase family protein